MSIDNIMLGVVVLFGIYLTINVWRTPLETKVRIVYLRGLIPLTFIAGLLPICIPTLAQIVNDIQAQILMAITLLSFGVNAWLPYPNRVAMITRFLSPLLAIWILASLIIFQPSPTPSSTHTLEGTWLMSLVLIVGFTLITIAEIRFYMTHPIAAQKSSLP